MEFKLVILKTKKLMELRRFYIDIMGLSIIKENIHSFRIAVGTSELEFTSKEVKDNPYYHFAFNIPSNKFKEAKAWIRKRVSLAVEDGEDEVYYSHLDAHALYFHDPAGNIVEFISRQSVSQNSVEPFTIESLLKISEISLTVDDALRASEKLQDIGVTERESAPVNAKNLNFMGNKENGVFVLLTEPRRRWFFSDKLSAIYPLEITLFNNTKIIINSEKKLETYAS